MLCLLELCRGIHVRQNLPVDLGSRVLQDEEFAGYNVLTFWGAVFRGLFLQTLRSSVQSFRSAFDWARYMDLSSDPLLWCFT